VHWAKEDRRGIWMIQKCCGMLAGCGNDAVPQRLFTGSSRSCYLQTTEKPRKAPSRLRGIAPTIWWIESKWKLLI
jgi:hypothetical protein